MAGITDIAQSQQFLDRLTAAQTAEYRSRGGTIHCARGCSNCCSLVVNCAASEALQLAAGLDEVLLERVDGYVERLRQLLEGVSDLREYLRRHRRAAGGCPLLGEEGACAAYGLRPLSCRALLSTRESSWCGTDFGQLSAVERESYLASLDRSAVAFPLHYLAAARDAGRELERQALLAMAGEYGVSLYGNMPVLVHLASRRGLAAALAAGAGAVRRLLQRSGLDQPLLLQLEEL